MSATIKSYYYKNTQNQITGKYILAQGPHIFTSVCNYIVQLYIFYVLFHRCKCINELRRNQYDKSLSHCLLDHTSIFIKLVLTHSGTGIRTSCATFLAMLLRAVGRLKEQYKYEW